MDEGNQAWLPIAHLLRPQGRRGELLADALTDLREVFREGREVWVGKDKAAPDASTQPVILQSHFFPTGRNAGRVVLKLAGTDSINEAELLSDRTVFIPAEETPTLEEDTYFVRDLIGCTVLDHGTPVGEVVDVEFATAPDGRTRLEDAAPLLVIRVRGDKEEEGEHMVPLIRAWIEHVDVEGKQVRMNLPEGLLAGAE